MRTLSVKKIPLIPRRTSSPVSIGRSNRTGCAKWTQHFRTFVLHRKVNGLLSEPLNGQSQASSPGFVSASGSPFKENTPHLIQSAARLGAGQFDTRKIGQQAPVYAVQTIRRQSTTRLPDFEDPKPCSLHPMRRQETIPVSHPKQSRSPDQLSVFPLPTAGES